jgi:hypothetical protein
MKAIRRGAAAVVLGGVSLATLPTGAEAQTFGSQDTARGTTVETRRRPDYDPLGVRLGAFRLNAAGEGGVGYDSNVFGVKNGVKSSGYSTEAGTVSLDSDWTRHAVGASAQISARQYFSQSTLGWYDYNVGTFGRYDFSAYTNVQANYRHYREHLDVYNYDVQTAGITKPVPYDSDEFQVTGTTRFNRLGLLATGLYRTYRFENVTFGNTTQNVAQQDFNSAIGAFGASYAVAPGRFVTAVVRLQDISYTNSISSGRDSFTYEALVGFQYDFDGVWQGRGMVGWRHRDYRSNAIKPLEGPAFEGTLIWVPTQLTNVNFYAARTIEESIRNNAVSYNRTRGGIRVDHELLRNVILNGDIRVQNTSYQSPKQSATDLIFTVGARWLINRNLALTGSYSYARRVQATGGVLEYDRNIVEVRLRVAL